MKTILYNPIFINPQAYYVFPRLTRYLQPDNESTSEPANYIGTIEVKVIAYGDTTLKRTYTNTDSIDLSEFKNTWIRISLFTKVGSCVLGEWKIGNMESDLPYIDPEVLASLKAVVIVGNKTNNDSDRAIVKNLVDASNPFVISNAAFKLNSGFGKYEVDFTTWSKVAGTSIITDSKYVLTDEKAITNGGYFLWNRLAKDSFKVKISNIPNGGWMSYRYRITEEDTQLSSLFIREDGIYTLPATVAGGDVDFFISTVSAPAKDWVGLTITQIPSFEGAFVTDGIDDLIKSTKSATEMLDGSNEVTVVSMIHQIKTNDDTTRNNWFFTPVSYLENRVVKDKIGKTGIYGYTSTNVTNAQISDITPILGDKNDYTLYSKIEDGDRDYFTVEGFQNQGIQYVSSIAWYWTIIANKVLTTDQINQVIAYFNLDRTLRPDILCNITKQGITNDNHADFNDKLIDYSGNGRDIQMNNLAWKGGSGIAAKKFETIKDYSIIPDKGLQELTIYNEFSFKIKSIRYADRYWAVQSLNKTDMSYPVTIITDKDIIWRNALNYTDADGVKGSVKKETNVPANTPTQVFIYGFNDFDISDDYTKVNCVAYATRKDITEFTVTFIPSYKGGLLLDGVNDFGKVTGMPVYKDYTVVTDREIFANIGAISSKNNPGAFVETAGNSVYSFGQATSGLNLISTRSISYLSKYSYCGQSITAGAAEDGTDMWLGTIRDNDTHFFNGAIYSLMTFPYSMSEFLIERQLKKHKLGTLYPDMVEFRPIIKANANYNIFYTALLPLTGNIWERINIGDYVPVGRRVAIQLSFDNEASELVSAISSQLGNISITKNSNNKGYTIFGDILKNKSPQKINITIDEYIRFEDIVQPYPVLLRFKDENGNEVSWGGKFKVGSTITRIGSAADSNLLPNIYNIFGLLLNDNQVTSSKVIVEKTMVFKAKSAYIFDNNEPKCILSPRLLRIPNSSYKILGYIPDISGHGNHGKINNSAYAGASGANGYLQNFSGWTKASGVSSTDSVISSSNNLVAANGWIAYVRSGTVVPTFKVEISGIPINGNLRFEGSGQTLVNGVNTIQGLTTTKVTGFYISSGYDNDWSNLRIEQVGEYEGAYCLDGVDDFVTIPTLSSGGKQVLMKVNWSSLGMPIYEQRTPGKKNFAIISNSTAVAYIEGNDGNTYIDGILNNNIKGNELVNITHNITITNELSEKPNTSPMISMNNGRNAFTKMSLYDFMLFDGISTDDKILELNEYVGIEAKIELPPYYWDAYGKTNLDGDKATIQQRGVAVGDYDLTNNNFAYDNMSGFGGYTLGKFTNSWSPSNNSNSISIVARNPYDITLKKLGGNSDWEFNTTELKIISNPVSVKFKSDKNIRFTCDYHYYTVGGNSEGAPLGITSKDLIANEDTIITISPISQENIDKYNIDINRGYYLIYFQLSLTLAVNEEVTIEMLPLYPNGLVYDGIIDYSENTNIPAFTDYTYIFKRRLLNDSVNRASMNKGLTDQQRATVIDFSNSNGNIEGYSFGNGIPVSSLKDSDIIYGTTNSVNGTNIIKGSNPDSIGINISKFASYYKQMIFYKLMLYPKTIPLLQINFLKNLMEKDEIIDLTNPIFIQE